MKRIKYGGQVEVLREWIMRYEKPKGYLIHSLTLNERGGYDIGVVMTMPNRGYEAREIWEGEIIRTSNEYARPVERFSPDMIQVTVADGKRAQELYHGIWIEEDGIRTRFLKKERRGSEREKEVWINLETGEEVKEEEISSEKMYEYGPAGSTCTAGQMKKKNITLVRTGDKSLREWDSVTYGAASIVCNGEEVSPKKIAQGNNRLSNFKAYSQKLGEIGCAGFYMGELLFDGGTYRDGWAFVSSEFVANKCNDLEREKYFFEEGVFDGFGIQCRPWTCKVMAEVVRSRYIERFAQRWEVVRLQREEITTEEQEWFVRACRKEESPFAGKLVVVGQGPIEFLTDLNGLKAPFNLKKASCLEILDISHEVYDIERYANITGQLLQSLMFLDYVGTFELMEELTDRLLKEKRERLMTGTGRPVSWADVQENIDYNSALARLVPKFGREEYAPLWRSELNKIIEGYVSETSRLRLPCAGAYTKIVSDTTADFGTRILEYKDGEMECVAPVCEHNGIEKCIGIKFPKQHFLEYAKIKVISIEEYCRRVEKSDLDDIDKELICEHVRALNGGIIMIPAIETVKKMMSGLDFDSDAYEVYFEKKIVCILWEGEPIAVIIEEDEEMSEAWDVAENLLTEGKDLV